MHLSLWYDAFNSQMLRRGIGGSNGISMLSFLRNLDLHSGYTKFTLQPMQDSFSPRFHWHFLIDFFWFCFLIFDGFWGFFVLYLISWWWPFFLEWDEILVLFFHFWVTSDVEQFFMYLFAVCTSSSEKSLFISDAHFQIGSLNWGGADLSPLYIVLSIWGLPDKCFSILCHLFILLIVSCAVQKLFNLMSSHLLILCNILWSGFCYKVFAYSCFWQFYLF